MPIRLAVMRIQVAVMRNWLRVMRNQIPTSRNLIVASRLLIVVMFAGIGSAAMAVGVVRGRLPPTQNQQGAKQVHYGTTRTVGAARRRR